MGVLNWLHLSDWHQGNTELDRTVVCDRLIDDIRNRTRTISPELEKIDFIVFTGDVSYSGKQEEYQTARRDFFNRLLEAANLESNRLFIIPGNHDLDMGAFYLLPDELKKPLETDVDVQKWTAEEQHRYHILEPFKSFRDFVTDYTKHEHPDYATINIFLKDGRTIAILGLNSAWMCGRHKTRDDIDDKNYVLIGEHQIHSPLDKVSGANIIIALLHHPFEWMNWFDRRHIEKPLTDKCDFILTGHEHTPSAKMISKQNGFYMQISTGASYSERISNDPLFINAYNLVHLDIEKKRGIVYLRRWSDRQNEWLEDIETFRDNGRRPFNLTIQLSNDLLDASLESAKMTASESEAMPSIVAEATEIQFERREPVPIDRKPSANLLPVTIFASSDENLRGRKYAGIQAAVNACKPNDTITIDAGVYRENICINRSSKIIGAGAGKTIIDGGKDGSVFTFGDISTGIEVVLSGMTIKGGIGTEVSVNDNDATKYICGGGILNFGELTITDIIIIDNVANYGGGIFNKGTLNLNDGTLVTHNTAYNGGGIYNSSGSRNIAVVNLNQGSSIVRNQATELGAGIYSGGCYPGHGKLSIHIGSRISENIAGNSGGGIWIFEGILRMQGGDISENKGWTGGGIYCFGGNNCLNGGSIENNVSMNGGGVVNAGGSLTLDGATIRGNTANKNDYGHGGGIQNTGTIVLKSGSVDHNTARTNGGGIWSKDPKKVSGIRQIVHDNTPDDISP